jgi:hypothetical protein
MIKENLERKSKNSEKNVSKCHFIHRVTWTTLGSNTGIGGETHFKINLLQITSNVITQLKRYTSYQAMLLTS